MVTPLERFNALLPETEYHKLKLLKEATDPFETNSAPKKKFRHMFGCFNNSTPRSDQGKILQRL